MQQQTSFVRPMQHYSLFRPDSEDGTHENAGNPSSRWFCSTDLSSKDKYKLTLYQQSQSKGLVSLKDAQLIWTFLHGVCS